MPFLLSLILALTHPTTDQIHNPEQVRISCSCDPPCSPKRLTVASNGNMEGLTKLISVNQPGPATNCGKKSRVDPVVSGGGD